MALDRTLAVTCEVVCFAVPGSNPTTVVRATSPGPHFFVLPLATEGKAATLVTQIVQKKIPGDTKFPERSGDTNWRGRELPPGGAGGFCAGVRTGASGAGALRTTNWDGAKAATPSTRRYIDLSLYVPKF